MSLVDLINSVVDEVQSSRNADPVTSVTSQKMQTLPLQPSPQAAVTPVTSVTSEKTNVREKTEAQNDDGDLRMAWLVLIDGKPARVVGSKKRSYIEVMRSIQVRWSSYDVEVVKL